MQETLNKRDAIMMKFDQAKLLRAICWLEVALIGLALFSGVDSPLR